MAIAAGDRRLPIDLEHQTSIARMQRALPPAMSPCSAPSSICRFGLSDDAVVQIHDFIHHFIDLFEARYLQHRMRPDQPPEC